MPKNSFSLIETIISILVLSFLTLSIAKIDSNSANSIENYQNIDKAYSSILQGINTNTSEVSLSDKSFKKSVYFQDGIYFYRYSL
ncbi:MAG: type IV pilus modification PilV family protein [Arcobacteraceae bacterium]